MFGLFSGAQKRFNELLEQVAPPPPPASKDDQSAAEASNRDGGGEAAANCEVQPAVEASLNATAIAGER